MKLQKAMKRLESSEMDKRSDKKHGYKEGGKKDTALDKKMARKSRK